MPRAGLSGDVVVDVALAVVDADGPERLTLSAVAARAGVATPSLYKHVGGLRELRARVTLRVLEELTDAVGAAVLGRAGDDALRALMRAYRAYVVAHPGRYAAMSQSPLDGTELEAVSARLLEVLLAVLRGYGLHGADAIHAARAVRATAHGFAVLEAAGGFRLAEDLDTSYALLTDALAARFTADAADATEAADAAEAAHGA